MKLLEIKDIKKKDIPLQYRRDFSGHAVISFPVYGVKKELQVPVEFTLESTALGGTRVSVSLRDKLDYPLVPVIRVVKEEILTLEKGGRLPE